MSEDTAQPDEAEGVVDPTTPEPEERYGASVTHSRGQLVLHAPREQLFDLVRRLRDDEGFNACVDVTAVDYLTYDAPRDVPAGIEPERFEVVVGLVSHERRERLRIRVQVPEADAVVPSIFDVHPGAEAFEREAYDMFGIRLEGHPLRKDYAIGQIPVQFKGVVNER